MSTYIWAWSDGDGNYINETESLDLVLHEVLETYSSAYDYFTIENVGSEYRVGIVIDGHLAEYKIDAVPSSVAEFLEQQAALVDRPDSFSICVK